MARPANDAAADETIYALSSGAPPAAIAIVRISGDHGSARRSSHWPELSRCPVAPATAALRDRRGDMLDQAMLLWLPGPGTATGEDIVELHLHGGRAVVAAVLSALAEIGLRMAEPGEFTRRALFNRRLDLTAVEGLADLLAAETESQRREALRRADGALGRKLVGWMRRLTDIAAAIEVAIDYDGEDEDADTAVMTDAAIARSGRRYRSRARDAARRTAREGLRVAIVGPPNAGKSTLFNALVGADAAIVSDIAGTTRDAIERPLALAGMPVVLVDTAGIRDSSDPIEAIGIARARRERKTADLILDLAGDEDAGAVSSRSPRSPI